MVKVRMSSSLFCGSIVMLIASMAGAQATNTFPASGNVGIGTTTPGNLLQVGGRVGFVEDPSAALPGFTIAGYSHDPSFDWSGALAGRTLLDTFTSGTSVEMGVYGEANVLGAFNFNEIRGGDFEAYHGGSGTVTNLIGLNTYSENYQGNVNKLVGAYIAGNGNFASTTSVANNYGIYLEDQSGRGTNNYQIYSAGAAPSYFAGSMGIGTTTPAYQLDVAGIIHTSTSVVFPDGSQQTTAWTGTVCGGDYAESVDVTGLRKSYEPGDVLVIDSNAPGNFLKSAEPYSTSVAGIYSTKPGLVGRREGAPKNPDTVPMAMVGIVPTKVVAENGPIHPGDLLVTSSTLGYAMKGTDRSKMLGAVIGKALDNLDSGKGVIQVVVMLQ
jgi:hypothetical protein